MRVDGLYVLYGGDVIECIKEEIDGRFTCMFTAAVPIRADLVNHCDIWTRDGKWLRLPYGIFDVEKEIES